MESELRARVSVQSTSTMASPEAKGSAHLTGTASALTTAVNMAVNLVGAGLLSLPWCLSRATVLPGIGLMLLMCSLNACSVIVICACAERSRVFSFVDMGAAAVGPFFGRFTQIVAALYAAGSCISYVVLIADFLPHALSGMGVNGDTWLVSRAFVIAVVACSVLLPLSLSRDLSKLRYSSYVALVGILFSCGVITWRGLSFSPAPSRVPWAQWSSGIFEAAPVLNVAFIMHYNASRYYEELRERSLKKMASIVACVFGGVFALYVSVAYFGVLAFGQSVQGDVLNDFADGSGGRGRDTEATVALVTRCALAVIISFTFPLALHSLRLSTSALLFAPPTASRYFNHITVALVAAAAAIGWAFKDVARVLSYKGALAGTVLVYIYPALAYAALRAQARHSGAEVDPEQSSDVKLRLLPPPHRQSRVAWHKAPPHIRILAAAATTWALVIMILGVLKNLGRL